LNRKQNIVVVANVSENERGVHMEQIKILMPLPDYDFDPTEASIPWLACQARGWTVEFSTEYGNIAQADSYKLKGPLPGLLSASAAAKAAYNQMTEDPAYRAPILYKDINPDRYHALLLPGGDGLRMRQYFESRILQEKVLQLWQKNILIGAICHGTLVLARTINPQTGHSVLYGYKVATVPKSLDRFAYHADKWLVKHGYIMYPKCVMDEVKENLEHPDDLSMGQSFLTPYAVSDRNIVSARTYMDADLFSQHFTQALQERLTQDTGN
jgi:putative intracellular protease/amidase